MYHHSPDGDLNGENQNPIKEKFPLDPLEFPSYGGMPCAKVLIKCQAVCVISFEPWETALMGLQFVIYTLFNFAFEYLVSSPFKKHSVNFQLTLNSFKNT